MVLPEALSARSSDLIYVCKLRGPRARFWARRGSFEPIERLVPVSSAHCCAYTPGLSTWWSSTALKGDLVSREVSRLDAFSGYPFRT